jgi:DNA repair exonuclease SbcCD ATPase subunit
MKIDGLDTDAEKELAELLSRIRIMDTSETTTMRRAIKKELAGRDADSNVTSLLTALDAREQTLDRRRRNAASSQPAEPEQGARVPRRMAREQSPPPSRERNRGLASRDPAETKAEALDPAVEDLTTRATPLTGRTGLLLRSGDALAGARGTETASWLQEANTWLSDVAAFLPGHTAWNEDFGNLPVKLRSKHRLSLATPLQGEIEKLSKRQSELAAQRDEVQKRLQPQKALQAQQPADLSKEIRRTHGGGPAARQAGRPICLAPGIRAAGIGSGGMEMA